MDSTFEFELGDKVQIGQRVAGEEKGVVIGRAEYSDAPPAYYVAYIDGTGTYRKEFFNAEDLGRDFS